MSYNQQVRESVERNIEPGEEFTTVRLRELDESINSTNLPNALRALEKDGLLELVNGGSVYTWKRKEDDMEERLAVLRDITAAQIPFTVHYPSKSSMVVTVTDSINNAQLRVMTELGANLHTNGTLLLLVVWDENVEN